jgi:hypothetical protein
MCYVCVCVCVTAVTTCFIIYVALFWFCTRTHKHTHTHTNCDKHTHTPWTIQCVKTIVHSVDVHDELIPRIVHSLGSAIYEPVNRRVRR